LTPAPGPEKTHNRAEVDSDPWPPLLVLEGGIARKLFAVWNYSFCNAFPVCVILCSLWQVFLCGFSDLLKSFEHGVAFYVLGCGTEARL